MSELTPPTPRHQQITLLDLSAAALSEQLQTFLAECGEPAYRERQITEWVYRRPPADFAAMLNLPKTLRTRLTDRFVLHPLESRSALESRDGTKKFLWRQASGATIESVVIPDGDRTTYCISSQAGCPVKCTFCATGYGGFSGQLSAGEIVDQVLLMRRATGAQETNVVYMGMGEPLLNFGAVAASLEILTHRDLVAIGARRITVSTVGVPERIRALGERFPQVNVALSLHAPTDELRTKLIPLNQSHPIGDVLAAVADHAAATGRRPTFEYIVLPGVNDSHAMARDLARLLRRSAGNINLIGMNPFPQAPYEKPELSRVTQFRRWLIEAEFRGSVTIRRSRGEDIQGACGQLSLATRRSSCAG